MARRAEPSQSRKILTFPEPEPSQSRKILILVEPEPSQSRKIFILREPEPSQSRKKIILRVESYDLAILLAIFIGLLLLIGCFSAFKPVLSVFPPYWICNNSDKVLQCPGSSSSLERIFSQLTASTNKSRNRINFLTLEDFMKVSETDRFKKILKTCRSEIDNKL